MKLLGLGLLIFCSVHTLWFCLNNERTKYMMSICFPNSYSKYLLLKDQHVTGAKDFLGDYRLEFNDIRYGNLLEAVGKIRRENRKQEDRKEEEELARKVDQMEIDEINNQKILAFLEE